MGRRAQLRRAGRRRHGGAALGEQRRLALAWQAVESWLFRERDWPSLDETQRGAIPEAAQLQAIDHRLDELSAEQDALLPHLQATPALFRAGLMTKLKALERYLDTPDTTAALLIVRGCRQDLRRLWP